MKSPRKLFMDETISNMLPVGLLCENIHDCDEIMAFCTIYLGYHAISSSPTWGILYSAGNIILVPM